MICPNCKYDSTDWKVYPAQCDVCKYEFKDHADGIELEDRGD
jgi:predicted Zn-ribbon and HTH transcriptional regulator